VNNVPFVIANAENGLDVFKNIYKIKSSKLNVLPQYLSLPPCSSEVDFNLRDKLKIPSSSIVVGMVAHYRPEKLHFLLLTAYQKIRHNFPDTYLIFLGNKNQTENSKKKYEKLARFITNNGLSNNVH